VTSKQIVELTEAFVANLTNEAAARAAGLTLGQVRSALHKGKREWPGHPLRELADVAAKRKQTPVPPRYWPAQ